MGSMSSALGSAASGAGAGSFISPGLGTAIGAGLGFVGGLLGNSAQSKANQQNIALQRETNELNAKLARENYQLQRDLLERNLQYASPKEQRRMLEEAGYNAYDFVNGTGSKPVAATPTPQLPSMGSAQVQPVNSFASHLQQFGNQFADIYRTLEEGKKMKSERVGTDIDNQTRLQINLQTLRNMGLDEVAKKLENDYNTETLEGRVAAVDLDNLLKKATADLTRDQQIEVAIRNKFAPYRNFWEVQNLVRTAKLLVEQGKTEITKQELNRAGVKKADAEAMLAIVRQYYEPQVAQSQIQANLSQASKNYSDAANTREVTSILHESGHKEAANKVAMLEQDIQNGKATYKQIVETTNEIQELAKYYKGQNQMRAYQMLLDYANLKYKLLIETMPDLPFAPTKIGAGGVERMSVPKPPTNPASIGLPFN